MSFDDVIKIVFCVVSSVGGIAGVIIITIKYLSDVLAERLAKKYDNRLKKELEEYKAEVDGKIYFTKAKFDAEFELYQLLSKSFFEMVKNITTMIPAGLSSYPADPELRKKYEDGLYDKAVQSSIIAQDVLNANIPFISKDFYNSYNEILHLCNIQLGVYEERWNALSLETQEEKESFSYEDYDRSRESVNEYFDLCDRLRDYLSKIDVLN